MLLDFSREGRLDRLRLLTASLDSLLRNTEARNTGWFCKFHELLGVGLGIIASARRGKLSDNANTLTNVATGGVHKLRPLGDAGPVIAAGGLFAYARQTGMIAAPPAAEKVVDAGPAAGPDD